MPAFRVAIVPASWDIAWQSLVGIAFRPPSIMTPDAPDYLNAIIRISLDVVGGGEICQRNDESKRR